MFEICILGHVTYVWLWFSIVTSHKFYKQYAEI